MWNYTRMSLEYDYINLPGNHLVGSYADDMSSVTVHKAKKEVEKEFKTVNNLTKECTRASGLSINTKKTFTFGSKKIKKLLPEVTEHCDKFRLVGCSVKISPAKCWTAQRKIQWQAVVQHVQKLPRSWNDKTTIIQSIMPKLTFGQGMQRSTFH